MAVVHSHHVSFSSAYYGLQDRRRTEDRGQRTEGQIERPDSPFPESLIYKTD